MTDKQEIPDIAADTVAHNGDLRDRIAALLDESLNRQKGIDRPDRFKDWIDNRELADAVIAALPLRTDQVGTLTRYVTEWGRNE